MERPEEEELRWPVVGRAVDRNPWLDLHRATKRDTPKIRDDDNMIISSSSVVQ